eukprot:TRINITY_DN11982_c0_g1_i1.p1 TRINITY_DN11982_c0_g1~~TRINITY_DN11982_c0_g1_i1.p1  ORF type:complete len:751 (+),score=138.75 TRINITY_DN11982_c0_g1_i1:253-2505(+)
MGKNPGSWIKSVLFRKKSSRSHEKLNKKDNGSKENSVTRKSYKNGDHNVLDAEPVQQNHLQNPTTVMSEPSSMREFERTPPPQEEAMETFSGSAKSVSALNNQISAHEATEAAKRISESSVFEPSDIVNDAEKLREESAAIKAQALLRGYLARKAFRALRGVIKLQALVRGYLVRRQATASLLFLQAVIKFQALFRGHRVRLLEGSAVQERIHLSRKQNRNRLESEKKSLSSLAARGVCSHEKVITNAFARHILLSVPKAHSLRCFSWTDESSSGWMWLERWMSVYPWSNYERVTIKAPTTLKRHRTSEHLHSHDVESERSKRTSKKSNYFHDHSNHVDSEAEKPKRGISVRRVGRANTDADHVDAEAEKPKRNFRKSSNPGPESTPDQPDFEPEKIKRNIKKVISHQTSSHQTPTAESMPENPEVEMEKVKRSLRKVSNSVLDSASEQVDTIEAEKIKRGLKKVGNSTTEAVSDHLPGEAEVPQQGLKKASNSTASDAVSANLFSETEASKNNAKTPSRPNSEIISEACTEQVTTSENPRSTIVKDEQLQYIAVVDQSKPELSVNGDIKEEVTEVVEQIPPTQKGQCCNPAENSITQGETPALQQKMDSVGNGNGPTDKNRTVDTPSKPEAEPAAVEHKTTRRRSSPFGTSKGENGEIASQTNSPSLPSYMAATESAKAKLRAASPRSSTDVQDKGTPPTRRHSLPASNGKQNSVSPRTQRLSQVQSHKSHLNRSIGTDRAIHVADWRR